MGIFDLPYRKPEVSVRGSVCWPKTGYGILAHEGHDFTMNHG